MITVQLKSILLLASIAATAACHAAGLPWARDYNAALAQAKALKKVVMVDFTASWCVHDGDGVTRSSPRTISYRLPSSGSARSISAVHLCVAGMPILCTLASVPCNRPSAKLSNRGANDLTRFFRT